MRGRETGRRSICLTTSGLEAAMPIGDWIACEMWVGTGQQGAG